MARRRKSWLTVDAVRALANQPVLLPDSWTLLGEWDWRNGHLALRTISKATRTLDGSYHVVDVEDFLGVLAFKGLGVYRVEGQDPTLVHLGWLPGNWGVRTR